MCVCVCVCVCDRCVGCVADSPVELLAVEHETVVSSPDDAALGGYRPRRVDVVACHHAHRDPRPLTLDDRVRYLHRSHAARLSFVGLQAYTS